ncbi:hypothetical protein MAXJ12_23402 [Mesorhizobium alhagi CCNWXJ12-2]|uniref:Uncharacterized protein n=1 Tax=Mesorhizobium alhagi CCNWXJ12-2 TaxID=1107882 RepID=H0HWT1_9HYPH|nr:hypothetical protein MAXJ12_23402 [Mesorhizobium alhagi CCNWXJ12-2]
MDELAECSTDAYRNIPPAEAEERFYAKYAVQKLAP